MRWKLYIHVRGTAPAFQVVSCLPDKRQNSFVLNLAAVLEKLKEVFHIGFNLPCSPTWDKKYGAMDKKVEANHMHQLQNLIELTKK